MAKNKKFYVVWKGKKPGIYDNWKDCKAVITGYNNAQYKSFSSFKEAQKAFNHPYKMYPQRKKKASNYTEGGKISGDYPINYNSIAVDAASSGNPGKMEYRGVDTRTQKELFHIGPFPRGTNNIGEFLAIVHGLAFLNLQQSNRIIYSDSRTAMTWIKRKKCNTKLKRNAKSEKVYQLITRAENWLKNTPYTTSIVKWDTKNWGEIPADFGRK